MIQIKSVFWTCIYTFLLSIIVSNKVEGEVSKISNQPTANPSVNVNSTKSQNSTSNNLSRTAEKLNPLAAPSSKDAASIALQKCEEYADYRYVKKWQPPMAGKPGQWFNTTDCANVETLITGGTEAKPKEYPHMALVGSGDSFENATWICGGSLISEKFVLSLARCGENLPSLGPTQWILLGDLNVKSEKDDAKPVVYKIKKVHQHPDYKSKPRIHDIALFELNTTVKISPYVRPACLYTSTAVPVNTTGKITGWGRTNVAEQTSDHLLKATVSFLDDQKCIDKYNNDDTTDTRNTQIVYDPNSMICAGDLTNGGDTCAGDSGGPLQKQLIRQVCMWNILGITSFGSAICGDNESPAVYTKVAFYLDWIQSVVWP